MSFGTSKSRSSIEVGAEIVAALMRGPATLKQIELRVGMCQASGYKWIEQLRASGAVRITDYSRPARGRYAPIFELQAPFAQKDAPKPTPGYAVQKLIPGGIRVAE